MAFSWSRANPFGAFRLLRSHPELSGLSIVNFLLYFTHHVFSAVFVLYAAHRYGWGPMEVGLLLGLVGAMDMVVQGLAMGPVVKRFGDRRVMVFGLMLGWVGMLCMGLAPTGWMFIAAMLPNALWGLAMPTIQSLMTARVSENEQGQLQGENNSVASIAGVFSPLFFGWIYGLSVGPTATIPNMGASFFIAGAILLAAAAIGLVVARRADEAALQNSDLPIEEAQLRGE